MNLAHALLTEHDKGEAFHPFEEGSGVETADDAYAVQDHYVSLLRERLGARAGYKVGLTSAKMQAMCGIDQPVAGVVFGERVFHSGAILDASRYGRLGVEFEIGVRLGTNLGPSPRPYAVETVAPAVSAICAAVEMVDDRNAEYGKLDALALIADNSWNAGIVVGSWQEPPADLGAVEGVVTLNGQEIGRGFGRDALGHPYIPLTWLANFRARTDRPLRKGDIVMTGSLIRTNFPTEPCKYRYELAGLGAVEVDVRF
jgi:2-keto-4-pentenoate hydratase